jgi:NADPH-dependent curcumin reductase CurA
LREVPVPEPQAGEVLIRVGYAGVNPSDSKARLEDAARAHRLMETSHVRGKLVLKVAELDRVGSVISASIEFGIRVGQVATVCFPVLYLAFIEP